MNVPPLRPILVLLLLVALGSGCNRTDDRPRTGSLPPATPASIAPAEGARQAAAETAPADPPAEARPAVTKDVTFDDIKFDHVKGTPFDRSLLTPAIKKLDGQPIRIRGFILPSFEQSGIKQFVLVRDNMQCCFGPGAALCDCIVVEMVGDASAEYTIRPVSVEGLFSIRELAGAEGTAAVFHLDGKQVK